MRLDLPYADPGVPDVRSPGQFLRWLLRGQRRHLLAGCVFGTLWLGAQALLPGIVGAGIDAVARSDLDAVARWAGVLLAVGAVQAAAGSISHRFACVNWYAAASRTQQLVARHAARLGGDLRRQVPTGEIVAVTAHDVERLGDLGEVIARAVGAVVAFAVVSALLLDESTLLGLVVVLGVPALTLLVGPLVRPLERRESAHREQMGRTTALAADTVTGLRVLRGIGGEDLFLDRFRAASQQVREAGVRSASIRSTLDAMRVALPGVFVVVVTWLGARLALDGSISVGALVAFYGYTAFLVLPLSTLAGAAETFAGARVAAGRVVRVLGTRRLLPEPTRPAPAPDGSGELTDSVTGLALPGGSLSAVVCDDPDEASALAERLGGLARPAGALGGVALDRLADDDARRLVLVQDRDPVLLAGRVRDVFDVPCSGAVRVADALAAASAEDVLDAVPGGLDGELTERARSLSGGQRQRLALARSLVVDPPVLVLEEPTSAVDAHTEARVAGRLTGLRRGRTTVLVTTSPLLLGNAETVAFVDGGTVAATGTHHHLLRTCPRYRDVVTRGADE